MWGKSDLRKEIKSCLGEGRRWTETEVCFSFSKIFSVTRKWWTQAKFMIAEWVNVLNSMNKGGEKVFLVPGFQHVTFTGPLALPQLHYLCFSCGRQGKKEQELYMHSGSQCWKSARSELLSCIPWGTTAAGSYWSRHRAAAGNWVFRALKCSFLSHFVLL